MMRMRTPWNRSSILTIGLLSTSTGRVVAKMLRREYWIVDLKKEFNRVKAD
jgi:hypothetical protein